MATALDIYQRQFCEADDRFIRLLAPAGSGKTHSLLWRCKTLFEKRGGASKFIIFTFTRAARDELRQRLSDPAFREVRTSVEITTLNSWGFRRVRQNHHSPKLQTTEAERSFCVQNSLQPIWREHPRIEGAISQSQFSAGKTIMNLMDLLKALGFDHRAKVEDNLRQFRALQALGLDAILKSAFGDLKEAGVDSQSKDVETRLTEFLVFWAPAVDHLIKQALFTLEDQKYVAWLDLRGQLAEGRRPVGAARYTHIFVDEFQDINPLDLAIIQSLRTFHDSDITIVGDDDQAIFEWRGASYRYIVEPKAYFNVAFTTFILERNYRSAPNIVTASQQLIRINQLRVPKTVRPVRTDLAKIEVRARPDFMASIDEVMNIVREFGADVAAGRRPPGSRLALISRKRAQLIPYQILLAAEQVRFCAAEDLQVFMSKAFDSLSEVLRICDDARSGRPRSRQIVDDIVMLADSVKRYPLSKKDKAALQRYLGDGNPRSYVEAVALLRAYKGALKGANDGGTMSDAFASSIEPLIMMETVAAALDALSGLTGMEKDYGKSTEDIFFADPPFFYLSRFATRYGTDFRRFLDDLDEAKRQLAVVPPDDDDAEQGEAESIWSRPVHLLTALRAKGKEFDTAVILDANDGIWPSVHAETAQQKEQERRLFYVAMTRAKSRLLLTVSGRLDGKTLLPSPYLSEAGFN
ncbi:MAG: ATP-dependent helicase [Bauldia sp.]|nr:ATP-dependent helicase [Bauldia sp.]MCW5716893.1 ATP-dependent helicase [Bauldia sp.]